MADRRSNAHGAHQGKGTAGVRGRANGGHGVADCLTVTGAVKNFVFITGTWITGVLPCDTIGLFESTIAESDIADSFALMMRTIQRPSFVVTEVPANTPVCSSISGVSEALGGLSPEFTPQISGCFFKHKIYMQSIKWENNLSRVCFLQYPSI